eukprot:XP_011668663.1 PREDICTED: P-selectin-like [Strongylocentrotus purpuratus]
MRLFARIGQEEGDVRLMNGGDELSGFVEIYHSSQWGRVCDQAWDLDNAIVTCVQLGCFRRDMTIEYCLDLCCMADYAYAGVESANECYCGNAGSNYAVTSPGKLKDSRCNQRCSGEAGTRCGGAFEIQIYECSAWTEPASRCKVPAAPENGMVDDAQRDYAVGDMVSFSCIAGYRIVGQATSLTCGANGVWNSSPPMCQKRWSACQPMTPLSNLAQDS